MPCAMITGVNILGCRPIGKVGPLIWLCLLSGSGAGKKRRRLLQHHLPEPEVAPTPLSAKSSGRKTKIGSPTQLHACLFGRNVSVRLRDVIDARLPVVDGQQSGIGRRIDVNGRII
jgi:hypothetical protein